MIASLVETFIISSISTKPLAFNVSPLSERSTILLHSPIDGASSIAPFNFTLTSSKLIAPDQGGAAAKGPSRVQVIANERNNSLVLRGKPQPISKIIKVVDKLDRPATTADSTQVIKLSHADAENVSKILSSVVVKNNSGEKSSQQPITIAADPTLNGLVVKADPGTMSEIISLIEKLDTPRAQVMIEAAIVEVTIDDSSSLGVELAAGDQEGKSVPLVSSSLNGVINGLLSGAIASGGGEINVLQGLATLSTPTIAAAKLDSDKISFGAVITAIANNSDANLLSTPSVLTLDNQEAKILVGTEAVSYTHLTLPRKA